jgi:hypothetical protein
MLEMAVARRLGEEADAECDEMVLYSDVSVVTVFFCYLQILTVIVIYAYMSNWKIFSMFLGPHPEIIVLPVYNNLLFLTTVVAIAISAFRLSSFPKDDEMFYMIKWFANRFLTEGLSIFLMHNGVGKHAVTFSITVAALWSSVSAVVPYYIYIEYGVSSFYVTQMVILSIMGVFYFANWLAPAEKLHRRPALISLARFYAIVYLLMLTATLILYFNSETSGCAVNGLLSLGEIMIPLLVYRTIYHDSLFWQGLFVRGTDNLNDPLIGMWDLDRETVTVVAQSISDLEKEIVPIIPFGMLFLDTSYFFSGGSARVYQGRYKTMDVAIKFLVCIELTPERVVSFCNEATILNSLQHPNVVKCYGVSVMPPALCLVTEFCHFGSLFDFLHSVGKDTDNLASADGASSQASSRASSQRSLTQAMKAGAAPGKHHDSSHDNIINDSSSINSSDIDGLGQMRSTEHSLSRHSSAAVMIRPPTSSTVLAVPERFSFSGTTASGTTASVSARTRIGTSRDISVLDTVTEDSTSFAGYSTSMAASSNQFYNQNVIKNLPSTISEAGSYAQSAGAASSLEGNFSGGKDSGGIAQSGNTNLTCRSRRLMSAASVMRNSFLGLGLGPPGVPKSANPKLTASTRQRCVVVWCVVVCCVVLWCGVVWCVVVCCGVLWCVVVCCGVLCCGVVWCVVLCYVCYAMLCYAMLCCDLLCCAMLCCALLCCDVVLCVVLCYAMLCCAMLCCALLCCDVVLCVVLCYAMLCYAMLCYVVLCCAVMWCCVLCYAMLCYAMLCYVVLCCAVMWCCVLCYDMICYAMLCCAMLCCALLCCDVVLCVVLCYVVLCYDMI